MKRIILMVLMACGLSGLAMAGTISGTVTNATTSAPISGQKVYIQDSLSTYFDSTISNSTGGYSFTIPSSISMGYMSLWAPACGYYNSHYTSYSGSNVTVNFSLSCGSSSSYTLNGTVTLSGIANNGLAKVYLIRQTYDSLTTDTILTAIDSISTASTGGSYSKTYSSMPWGTLLVKAALQPSHPAYASYLPTYYTSNLNWSGATHLTSANFTGSATNINMISGTNPGGPGFIGGSVLLGANKNIGDPLENRLILLTDATGKGVAYTYSDATGKFQFPSLPYGTYNIFGDAWGKSNPKLTVTLSASVKTISNVIFEENSSKFAGHIGATGIGNTNVALSAVSVYPNPATDHITVSGLATVKGDKTIVLSSMTGAVISRTVATGAEVNLSMSSVPAGIYMLQVKTEAGSASFQIVK